MQSTQIPAKFPIPFGNNAAVGTIRSIPQASQTATSPGQASLYDGFPVATGQPLASGGVPPAMQDFNGLLNQISAWSRWQAAAGLAPYDPTFSTAIGGYPAGAVIFSASTAGRIWISTAENNTTNPDGGNAANWLPLMLSSDIKPIILNTPQRNNTVSYTSAGTYNWTVPTGVNYVFVRLVGAGGGSPGGNGNVTYSGGGGGSGGYSEGWVAVTPGQNITIVVGAGGSASGNTNGAQGGAGGSTSFGSSLSALGGGGGNIGSTSCAGGTAGIGSGGSLNLWGAYGGDGNPQNANVQGGQGAASAFGGGGRTSTNGSGSTGLAPGSGAGAIWGSGGTSINGAAGAAGAVFIQY